MMNKKNVVVIGGGTGTYAVLQGLKQYSKQVSLSAVVTMADSGGSTGRLRDEFGYLPVGDVRMALAALASEVDEHQELVRELFLYRFDKGGGLLGHNFGNLLLVALTDILGSEEAAIHAASRLLGARGLVFPITTEKVHLKAVYDDGIEVVGEHDIDEPPAERAAHCITNLSVTPQATISESAESVILNADLIVLGPGDLYTSVLANCVVDGVAEAIQNSGAKIVYVCNLMTKVGQTTGMDVKNHVEEINKYINVVPNYVLVNSGEFPNELLKKYESDGERPVVLNETIKNCEIIQSDMLATEAVQTTKGDVLKRSLIRHNPRKLARKIINILSKE